MPGALGVAFKRCRGVAGGWRRNGRKLAWMNRRDLRRERRPMFGRAAQESERP